MTVDEVKRSIWIHIHGYGLRFKDDAELLEWCKTMSDPELYEEA